MEFEDTIIAPRWWQAEPQGAVAAFRCGLCPHECLVPLNGRGYCLARNADGRTFTSPWLGRFVSTAVDPIEKKPLRHWRPGSFIFSLGSLGCNMKCPFCQNHSIAQPREVLPLKAISPHELALKVRTLGLDSLAYTYNEPLLQAEYIIKAAPILKEAGVATVLVTNGQCSPDVLRELTPWIQAVNVDIKAFNPATYHKMGGSFEAVKRSVEFWVKAGIHVELTALAVPGLNDGPDEFAGLVEWVAALSPKIPLHISRYFPAHKFSEPPTDPALLKNFKKIAAARLRHVYLGNI